MNEFTFKEFANKVSNNVHKLVETDFETYFEFVNDGVRVSLDEYYGDDVSFSIMNYLSLILLLFQEII